MRELNPKQTKRARAFELWMNAPMPMVTVFKTLDVTNLLSVCKKSGFKFNALLCYAIGKAASQIEEFYLLATNGKLFQFDKIAINVIVNTPNGINNCDIPFCEDLKTFHKEYLRLTKQASTRQAPLLAGEEYAIVGTSAVVGTEIDGVVNLYSGLYNNPFLAWGKYRKKWFNATLPLSLQVHHTQMDGNEVARFLELLQAEIKNLRV